MSAELNRVGTLRAAAAAERDEWGGTDDQRSYPKSSAIHLALADWLDFVADGRRALDSITPAIDASRMFCDTEAHALIVARAILAGAS